MNVDFKRSFAKDLMQLPANIRTKIKEFILLVESSNKLSDLNGLIKLSGQEDTYRIHVTYRYVVIFEWNKETQVITMLEASSRENAYKK
jgi:mRNA-degrading endonuclease RelE of RelBE toxin-antitoxin system